MVASDAASIPEVVGNAALVTDCRKPEDLAESIYRVISDEKLKQELIESGFDRAKTFDWKETAEKTIDTYRKTLKRSREETASISREKIGDDIKSELYDLEERESEQNSVLQEVIERTLKDF